MPNQILNTEVFDKLIAKSTIDPDSNNEIVGIDSEYNAYFLRASFYINENRVDIDELGLKKRNGKFEWFKPSKIQLKAIESKLNEAADLVYERTLADEQFRERESIEWYNTKNALQYLFEDNFNK